MASFQESLQYGVIYTKSLKFSNEKSQCKYKDARCAPKSHLGAAVV